MRRRSRFTSLLVLAGLLLSTALAGAWAASHRLKLAWYDYQAIRRFGSVPGGLELIPVPGQQIQSFSPHPGWSLWPLDDFAYKPGPWFPRIDATAEDCSLTIPFWFLLLPVAALTAALAWQNRRPAPETCPRCGYNLRGNLSGRCPECGTSVPAGDSSQAVGTSA